MEEKCVLTDCVEPHCIRVYILNPMELSTRSRVGKAFKMNIFIDWRVCVCMHRSRTWVHMHGKREQRMPDFEFGSNLHLCRLIGLNASTSWCQMKHIRANLRGWYGLFHWTLVTVAYLQIEASIGRTLDMKCIKQQVTILMHYGWCHALNQHFLSKIHIPTN